MGRLITSRLIRISTVCQSFKFNRLPFLKNGIAWKFEWTNEKEIELGITADVGTLQRFPKIIGNDSQFRELAFTGRRFHAAEAKEMGFVSRILPDRDSLIEAALDTASLIAGKSPVAVSGSKISIVYSRDHSVADGLDHICDWNQGMVQTKDILNAIQAGLARKPAKFSKL